MLTSYLLARLGLAPLVAVSLVAVPLVAVPLVAATTRDCASWWAAPSPLSTPPAPAPFHNLACVACVSPIALDRFARARRCNPYTATMSSCASCSVTAEVDGGKYCAGWCNAYTCAMQYCKGCGFWPYMHAGSRTTDQQAASQSVL